MEGVGARFAIRGEEVRAHGEVSLEEEADLSEVVRIRERKTMMSSAGRGGGWAFDGCAVDRCCEDRR